MLLKCFFTSTLLLFHLTTQFPHYAVPTHVFKCIITLVILSEEHDTVMTLWLPVLFSWIRTITTLNDLNAPSTSLEQEAKSFFCTKIQSFVSKSLKPRCFACSLFVPPAHILTRSDDFISWIYGEMKLCWCSYQLKSKQNTSEASFTRHFFGWKTFFIRLVADIYREPLRSCARQKKSKKAESDDAKTFSQTPQSWQSENILTFLIDLNSL